MKRSAYLILLLTSLFFMSSCASVFEARNYGHLHYVKVKKDQQEIVQSTPIQKENVQSMVNKEEHGITITEEAPLTQKKAITQKQAPLKATEKTNSAEKNLGVASTIGSVLNDPTILLSKEQQYKIESESRELFGDLDHDLRMALIFGIAGIVVLFFVWIPDVGFVFAIIASILILIALIYLIKYLVENG